MESEGVLDPAEDRRKVLDRAGRHKLGLVELVHDIVQLEPAVPCGQHVARPLGLATERHHDPEPVQRGLRVHGRLSSNAGPSPDVLERADLRSPATGQAATDHARIHDGIDEMAPDPGIATPREHTADTEPSERSQPADDHQDPAHDSPSFAERVWR